MSFWLAVVGFGAFGRLGAIPRSGAGGGAPPSGSTPTYYIYGF